MLISQLEHTMCYGAAVTGERREEKLIATDRKADDR